MPEKKIIFLFYVAQFASMCDGSHDSFLISVPNHNIVSLLLTMQNVITYYENQVLSQKVYFQNMYICTYNGFV